MKTGHSCFARNRTFLPCNNRSLLLYWQFYRPRHRSYRIRWKNYTTKIVNS